MLKKRGAYPKSGARIVRRTFILAIDFQFSFTTIIKYFHTCNRETALLIFKRPSLVGRARTNQFPPPLGREQFPMAFRDNFDSSVDHYDGGLVVNRVGRHWYLGGHSFHVGRGTFRVVLVIQVRKQRKVN
jgi:hypothetical protein